MILATYRPYGPSSNYKISLILSIFFLFQFRINHFSIPTYATILILLDETHAFLRTVLAKMYDDEVAQATRIQYGGSVTPDSVDELMSMPEIDGCLVGGASLDAEKFGRIINYKKAE